MTETGCENLRYIERRSSFVTYTFFLNANNVIRGGLAALVAYMFAPFLSLFLDKGLNLSFGREYALLQTRLAEITPIFCTRCEENE
jgi:hypothetical protein